MIPDRNLNLQKTIVKSGNAQNKGKYIKTIFKIVMTPKNK